jgi:hypothetical protein
MLHLDSIILQFNKLTDGFYGWVCKQINAALNFIQIDMFADEIACKYF